MTSDPPELGKGIFGYRKSAVNQILADRDVMLRQAEGRVRAAESKVAELESELVSMRQRNSRMDEQLERLRTRMDAMAAGTPIPPAAAEPPVPEPAPAQDSPPVHEPAPAPEAAQDWEAGAPDWEAGWSEPSEESAFSHNDESGAPDFDFSGSEASFAGLDRTTISDDDPFSIPEMTFEDNREKDDSMAAHLFDQEHADVRDGGYELPAEEPAEHGAWMDEPAPAEPIRKIDELYMSDAAMSDASMSASGADEPAPDPAIEDDAMASVPYGFSFDTHPRPEDEFEMHSGAAAEEETAATSFYHAFSDSGPESPQDMGMGTFDAPLPAAEPYSEPAPSAAPEPEASPVTSAEPAPFASASADPAASVSPQTAELANRFVTEELSGILAAAEESAARIVERARATTQHQIAQSNRLWREVQAEVARFATWREQVEPVIRSVQGKLEGVRAQIEDVPERIRQALAPMADSISSIDSDLAELASASSPPLLLAPGGMDSSGDVSEWAEGHSDVPPVAESGAGEGAEGTDHLAG